MAREKSFRGIPKDPGSPPHQNICAIVVDESAAFLILRPQSLHTPSDKVSLWFNLKPMDSHASASIKFLLSDGSNKIYYPWNMQVAVIKPDKHVKSFNCVSNWLSCSFCRLSQMQKLMVFLQALYFFHSKISSCSLCSHSAALAQALPLKSAGHAGYTYVSRSRGGQGDDYKPMTASPPKIKMLRGPCITLKTLQLQIYTE